MTLVELTKSGQRTARSLRAELEQATLCRALSVAFRPPRLEQAEELRALASALSPAISSGFSSLADEVGPHLEDEYHRLLGAAGSCSAAESDHLPWRTMAGKGALLGDVSAYYTAFAFDPTAELRDSPDNLAIELSFLGWLHLKAAHALDAGRTEDAETCERALTSFTEEHLATWLGRFLDKLEATAPEGFYGRAGRLLREHLAFEPAPERRGAPDLLAFAGVPIDDGAGAPPRPEEDIDDPREWPSPPLP